MGGKGSGGSRVNAGRKKKDGHLRLVDGGADKRGALPTTGSTATKEVERFEPPADLPADVLATWTELAPHAFDARTLTRGTAAAFRDLCEAIVLKRKLLETIEKDGYTYLKVTIDGAGQEHQEVKAHPLLAQHRGTMQRVEAGLLRFCLSPSGKGLYEPDAPAANPVTRFLKGKASTR